MTFVVDGDIVKAVSLLDNKRLGKQRVEAYQLIRILEGKSDSWKSHPALKMWIGYLDGLKYYYNCCVNEWIKRGKNNTMEIYSIPSKIDMPWWINWDRLHYSHQAMLNRKEPSYYSFSVPSEYMKRGYIWPHSLTPDDKDKNLEEITVELPDYLLTPSYCNAIVKTGARKGHCCGRLLQPKQPEKCGAHSRSKAQQS